MQFPTYGCTINMTNFSLRTIEKIKRKWMVGYNEDMICRQLKMTKKVYREYDRWIHDLLHSKLFKLAKDGYITTLIDSMEQRANMADLLNKKRGLATNDYVGRFSHVA